MVLAISLFLYRFCSFCLCQTCRLLCVLFVAIDILDQTIDKIFVVKPNLPLLEEGLHLSNQILREPTFVFFDRPAKEMFISEIDADCFLAALIDDNLHPLDIILKTIILVFYTLNSLHFFMVLLQLCGKILLVLLQIFYLLLVELYLLEDQVPIHIEILYDGLQPVDLFLKSRGVYLFLYDFCAILLDVGLEEGKLLLQHQYLQLLFGDFLLVVCYLLILLCQIVYPLSYSFLQCQKDIVLIILFPLPSRLIIIMLGQKPHPFILPPRRLISNRICVLLRILTINDSPIFLSQLLDADSCHNDYNNKSNIKSKDQEQLFATINNQNLSTWLYRKFRLVMKMGQKRACLMRLTVSPWQSLSRVWSCLQQPITCLPLSNILGLL